MQKFILSFLMVFALGSITIAQTDAAKEETSTVTEDSTSEGGPVMDFESMEVNYGTIEQHGEPLRVLKFSNTGTEPLVIKNARGSCGCTVPTWPKEPIMPGEESEIEVRYATNRLGKINKTIKITTNEGGDPHVIKVLGQVEAPAKEESVPASAPTILKGE